MRMKTVINSVLWTVVAIVFMLEFGQPFYLVNWGHAGVETCFGAVRGHALESGTSVKLPWCEVTNMHVQARTLPNVEINAPTIDLQELKGKATVQYTILASSVTETYQTLGDEQSVEENIIIPGLHEVAKSVTAGYTGTDLFYQRDKAQGDMAVALQTWVDEVAKARGLNRQIEVQGVQLTEAHFTKLFEDALQAKAVRAQELERANTKLQTQVQAALGQAAKITRNAEAEATTTRVNAESEAKAMMQQAEQLARNPQLLCYTARSKWSGHLSNIGHGRAPFDDLCAK